MRTFSRYLLESPIDELPAAVEGVHPHQTENTYEEEKDSVTRDENWPPQADIGFTSTHIYQDPDSGIKTHIEMDHVTPGWEKRKDRNQGVARCEVTANGMFGDSSKTGSRFHMPGEIMGKIASSSSHLHDFITKYKPHTVEYSTTDSKRDALYQHMGRHLYPHIWFNNIREVEPVERKPKKSLTDSVDTNYWNMITIRKFILESPIDELPAAVEGPHPHKIHDTYEQEKELSRKNPELGFQSLHIYHDPDNRLNTTILANHLAPGWTGDLPDSLFPYHTYKHIIPSRNAGIAHISTQVKGSFDDKSKYKFHMPGEIMGMIKSSASHVHHFITEHTPLGLHTITYQTKDPKRHALYQHMARLYPHITFKNTDEVAGVKQTSSKALTDSVDTNYWNMITIRKFILESPIDELPAAVEGPHPHITFDDYEDEKERKAKLLKDDPTPYRGNETHDRFKSTREYKDPDSGVTTTIDMVHRTPGSTREMTSPNETVGSARVQVAINNQYNDVSSESGSRFQMPGDIMKKISVASGHLHHFIGEHTPLGLHTIEYNTDDPKRHALYQHMGRLYPHITFRNYNKKITGRDLTPVKRKPKKSLTDSVDTNYWNMITIRKFILESPIDELPAAVEGPHPQITFDDYETVKKRACVLCPYSAAGVARPSAERFRSYRVYHDPDSGVKTNITMDHKTPGSTREMGANEKAGVARVEVSVNREWDDVSKSGSGFQMPGDIMKKISVASGHLGHAIGEYTPLGLHTIEYNTPDPKRHALYQHMGRLYPHITFRNTYTEEEGKEMTPIKRKPKKPLADSVDTNYWNMITIRKFILESPIDELPAAVEGDHPHQTWDNYKTKKKAAGHWMKVAGHEAPTGFKTNHVYHDPHSEVATDIHMIHGTPGWTGVPHPSVGVAHVSVSVGAHWDDASRTGSGFLMPSDIMGKIKVSREHIHDFITKYTPHGLHTIEYETTDPKRHALYQHIGTQYPHILFRNTTEVKPVERKPKKPVEVSEPVAIPESYSQKQMRVANQTSRNSGAIGKKAITPAYVKTITGKKHKILDFGSGRDAAHTKALRKTGRQVTAHEFGANVNKNHNPKALEKKYDTVFASNVLNTSSSRKMLSDTLDQMHSAVAPGGALVANLPLSPRKSVKVDAKHLMRQLLNRFGDVRRVGGTKKAPLFHATGPK